MTTTSSPRPIASIDARAAAVIVLAGCAGAAVIMAIGPAGGSVYDAGRWLLLIAFVASAIALILVPMRAAHVPGAAGAVFGVQLTATGIVAFRHWSAFCGPGACNLGEVDVERPLALVLAVVMSVATSICLALLARSGLARRRRLSLVDGLVVFLGLAIVATVPAVFGSGSPNHRDLTSLGAFALLYSLPWGLALAAGPWLTRAPAAAAAAAVAVSCAVVAAIDQHIATTDNAAAAAALGGTAAIVCMAAHVFARRDGPA